MFNQLFPVAVVIFNNAEEKLFEKPKHRNKRYINFFKTSASCSREIKNFIPIHFNSYIKDYSIVDSSPIKNKVQSRLLSVEIETKKRYINFKIYLQHMQEHN